MRLIFRRILYSAFILLFLIFAPLLLLYANGYRYDFNEKRVQKTGILILESRPKKVKVYINDRLKYTKTPIIGENLLPNFYDIKVAKNGYYPWEKRLEIKSNLTTFAQDIILFKKTAPIKIIDGDFGDFTLSPNNERIVTLWQDDGTAEIWGYDLKSQNSKLILRKLLNNSKIEIKKWSANGKNLLLNNHTSVKDNYFIVKFKESFWSAKIKTEVFQLNKTISQPIINLKWDNSDENIIYAQTDNLLYRINLVDKTFREINVGRLSGFIVYDKILCYNTDLSCLVEINKNPIQFQRPIKSDCVYRLTKDNDYALFSGPRGFATLISPASNNLLVVDLNNKNKIFEGKAKKIKWDTVSNKMLYYNDIEVGIFSPAHQDPYKKEVIGRYSQEIKNILWYPSHHHLLLLFNNNFKILELDVRDKRNVIDFDNFSDLKNIYLDKEGKNIYLVGRKDGKEGVWQINIF